jgi:hypothetical protein
LVVDAVSHSSFGMVVDFPLGLPWLVSCAQIVQREGRDPLALSAATLAIGAITLIGGVLPVRRGSELLKSWNLP